jgi:hypothetical protein
MEEEISRERERAVIAEGALAKVREDNARTVKRFRELHIQSEHAINGLQ